MADITQQIAQGTDITTPLLQGLAIKRQGEQDILAQQQQQLVNQQAIAQQQQKEQQAKATALSKQQDFQLKIGDRAGAVRTQGQINSMLNMPFDEQKMLGKLEEDSKRFISFKNEFSKAKKGGNPQEIEAGSAIGSQILQEFTFPDDPPGGVSVSPEVTGLAEQIRAEAPLQPQVAPQPTAQPQVTPQQNVSRLRDIREGVASLPETPESKAFLKRIDDEVGSLEKQIPTQDKVPTATDIDDSFNLRVNAFSSKNNRPPNEQELVDIRNQAIDDNKRQQSADRAFEKESDKLFVKRIDTRNTEAEEAAFRINRTAVRRQLLNDGMFTGSLANVKTSVNKWLQEAGFEINGQKVANTETFAAISGQDVGEIIKLFGSGTGLSDADREYAQQIVAGNITLTKDSILQILNIRDRIDTALINRYNTGLGKAKSKRPEANILNEEVGIPTTEGSTGNFLKQAPNAEFNKRGKLTKAVDQAEIGTIKEYLRATGGNKLQAQKLMRMNGWKF